MAVQSITVPASAIDSNFNVFKSWSWSGNSLSNPLVVSELYPSTDTTSSRYLQSFWVTQASISIRFSSSATRFFTARDLSTEWEGAAFALVFSQGTHSVTVPGPSHSSISSSDTNNPYSWAPNTTDLAALLQFFFTDLDTTQDFIVQLTDQDGLASTGEADTASVSVSGNEADEYERTRRASSDTGSVSVSVNEADASSTTIADADTGSVSVSGNEVDDVKVRWLGDADTARISVSGNEAEGESEGVTISGQAIAISLSLSQVTLEIGVVPTAIIEARPIALRIGLGSGYTRTPLTYNPADSLLFFPARSPILYFLPQPSGTPPFTYAFRDEFAGLSIDSSSGIISGNLFSEGRYRLVLEISDALNNVALGTIDVIVYDGADAELTFGQSDAALEIPLLNVPRQSFRTVLSGQEVSMNVWWQTIILGIAKNEFVADTRAEAESARDSYAQANPSWYQSYLNNEEMIVLRYGSRPEITTYQVLTKGGNWVDSPEGFWYASLYSPPGTPVILGKRITLNSGITDRVQTPTFDGRIGCQPITPTREEPRFGSWGVTHRLVYEPE